MMGIGPGLTDDYETTSTERLKTSAMSVNAQTASL